MVSLYIHIPFCKKKCPYCHFFVVADNELLKDKLEKALLHEWERVYPKIANDTIVSIYFGGGTPSLFGPKRIETLINAFSKRAHIASDVETTLEVNPESATYASLRSYRLAGINRLSFGVQSFIDSELAFLGREHSAKDAQNAIFDAKKACFDNITIDLMYEQPHQTLDSWQKSLDIACQMPIDHLSLYNLTIEPHTAFYRKKEALDKARVPDDEKAKMYEMAIKTLESSGFLQYEISAFCRNEKRSRHNLGYWQARPFFGLGPSAYSFFNNVRFQNVCNFSRYVALLESGSSPVDFIDEITPDARKKELFTIALRVKEGVEKDAFVSFYGTSIIQKLTELQFIDSNKEKVFLTEKGRLFYNDVALLLI